MTGVSPGDSADLEKRKRGLNGALGWKETEGWCENKFFTRGIVPVRCLVQILLKRMKYICLRKWQRRNGDLYEERTNRLQMFGSRAYMLCFKRFF